MSERCTIILRNVEKRELDRALTAACYGLWDMPGNDAIVGSDRDGVYFYVKRNKRSISVTQENPRE